MPETEVTLPDRVTSDIDRFIDSGEFLNWDQAVEELLTLGISAYSTTEEPTEESVFQNHATEQKDPAMEDSDQDEGTLY